MYGKPELDKSQNGQNITKNRGNFKVVGALERRGGGAKITI